MNNFLINSSSVIVLSKEQRDVLTGILLGDAYMFRSSPTANSLLQIEQTYPKHEQYVLSLYSVFISLMKNGNLPKVQHRKPDKRTGKIYSTIRFSTRHLPCLNEFFDLFYLPDGMGKYKKTVPKIIKHYLTPVGLAHWIIDDGHRSFYNQTVLNTNSFTYPEISLLQEALFENFGLHTRTTQKRPGEYLIHIPVKQSIPLKDIVGKYIIESMRHKIKSNLIENIYRSSCFFNTWEGISISSYLLINFWVTRIQANKSAIKALVVNRVGDMFLSIGFFAIFFVFGNLDYSTVFSIAPFINETIITIIGLLLLLAAMGKSAQLGLHTWLPDQPSFHFISNHLSIYKSARSASILKFHT